MPEKVSVRRILDLILITQWNLSTYESQATEFFSIAGRFLSIQAREIWILGTLKGFP
jgi:hypothetical protein